MNAAEIAKTYTPSVVFIRWAALIIDNIFVILNLILLPFFLKERYGEEVINSGIFAAVIGASLLMILIYFTVTEGLTGYTFGKLLLRIRVVDKDGNPPGLWRAFLRALLRVFEINLFGLVGFLVALTSSVKQRLGDMIAHTYVLRSKDIPQEQRGFSWGRLLPCGIILLLVFGVLGINISNIGFSAAHPNNNSFENRKSIIISHDKQSQLTLPDGWSKGDLLLNKVNAEIKAMNFNETIFFISHTYPKANQSPDTKLEDLVSIVNEDLLKRASPRKQIIINGYQALQFSSTELDGFSKYHYLFTCIETTHNFHLLICWADESPFENKLPQMRAIVLEFKEVVD